MALQLAGLLALVYVAALAATLVHELGHGIAALRAVGGHVVVRAGGDPAVTLRLGRLVVALGPLVAAGGDCLHKPPASARAAARIAAGGPLASLLGALGAGAAWAAAPGPLHPAAGAPALACAAGFLASAAPVVLGGRPTDGARVLAHRTGAPGLVLAGDPARAMRPYPLALAFVTAAAFLVDVTVGVLLLAVFGAAAVLERRVAAPAVGPPAGPAAAPAPATAPAPAARAQAAAPAPAAAPAALAARPRSVPPPGRAPATR
jgi:2-oxoglutarate dehydrogenase E2 component (dihydrolipoamide succinyltransferase)